MLSRRTLILVAALFVAVIFIFDNRDALPAAIESTAGLMYDSNGSGTDPTATGAALVSGHVAGNTFLRPVPTVAAHVKDSSGESPLSPIVLNYFDQVFSEQPAAYDFPALQQRCESTTWMEGDVLLQCGGMSAGLTSIISQVKVCIKMAIDAGTGLVLPTMPLRDSHDLKNFNFLNPEAQMTYDKWFDAAYIKAEMQKACPKMKILHPSEVGNMLQPLKNKWNIDIGKAPGYRQFSGYFWCGKPFGDYFAEEYKKLLEADATDPNRDATKKGITVISIASQFLIYRITDDPTRRDLELWNDLSTLIRFNAGPRQIVDRLLNAMDRPWYGVHFRVESDTIWSPLEHQLAADLDALDQAWEKYGKSDAKKPMVYLACGDQEQVEKFVAAGKERGWDVTHKWALAKSNVETTKMINDLPFDFQGAVDMGVMMRSHFFLGITGSAFSSSIANARDVTGRYRGSTFTVPDDQNARTHLFNDGDASQYACCL